MSRMVWIALGAAGGIVAYRKGQELLEEARNRGVIGSLQAASGSAAGLAEGTRSIMQKALTPNPVPPADAPAAARPSGTAAARALAQARRSDSSSAASVMNDRTGRENH